MVTVKEEYKKLVLEIKKDKLGSDKFREWLEDGLSERYQAGDDKIAYDAALKDFKDSQVILEEEFHSSKWEDERPPLVVMPGESWPANNDIINKINTQNLSSARFERSPKKPKEFLAFLMNQKAVKIREAHLALDSHKIVFFEDFKEEETRADVSSWAKLRNTQAAVSQLLSGQKSAAAAAKAEKEKTQEVEQQKDNYILEGFKEIHKFENEEERVRNEKAKVMKTENLKGLDEHIFFYGGKRNQSTLDGIPDEFHAKVAKIEEITGVENLPDNEEDRELAISKFQKRFGFDKPVSYKYLFWKKPYKKESFGKVLSSRGEAFILPASETNASGGIWGRQLKKLLDGTWSDEDEFKFWGDWRYMYDKDIRDAEGYVVGGEITSQNEGCCDVCAYCGVNDNAPITDFFVINSGFWVCKNRNDDGEPCWLGLVEEIEKKSTLLNKMKDKLTKWKKTRNVSHIEKLNEYKEELLAYIDKYDSLSEDKYSILQEVNKAIKEGSVSQTAPRKAAQQREGLKMGKATFGFPGGRRRRKKTVKRRKTKRTKKRKTKRRKKKKRKSNRRK